MQCSCHGKVLGQPHGCNQRYPECGNSVEGARFLLILAQLQSRGCSSEMLLCMIHAGTHLSHILPFAHCLGKKAGMSGTNFCPFLIVLTGAFPGPCPLSCTS